MRNHYVFDYIIAGTEGKLTIAIIQVIKSLLSMFYYYLKRDKQYNVLEWKHSYKFSTSVRISINFCDQIYKSESAVSFLVKKFF